MHINNKYYFLFNLIIQFHLPIFLLTSESNDEVFAENVYADTHGVLDEQQYSDDDYDRINFEIEGADQESGTRHIMDDENLSSGNQVGGNEETRPINPDQN